MCSMTKFWTTLACLSVLGCAEGSPSQPVTQITAPVEVEPPKCGNGVVDVMAGEDCDCGDKVTGMCQVDPTKMDCNTVGRGNGTLLCLAAPACKFEFSSCDIKTPASNGGSGARPMTPGGMMMGTGGTGR